MIITCQACSTSFELDEKRLKPTGSKVRCSVCSHIFTAVAPHAPPLAERSPERQPPVAADTAASVDQPDADGLNLEAAAASEERDPLFEAADRAVQAETPSGTAFASEPVSDPSNADAATVESDVTVMADLDDEMDFTFDDPAGVTETVVVDLDQDDAGLEGALDEAAGLSVAADLDDDELDLTFDDPAGVAETVVVDLDQDDAGLEGALDEAGGLSAAADLDDDELDLTFDDPAGVAETVAADPDRDDAGLDDAEPELDGGFSLQLDDTAAPPVAGGAAAAEATDDLDVQNLELQFDEMDPENKQPAESVGLEDDLDLSSLDILIEDDQTSEMDAQAAAGPAEPELELETGDARSLAESDDADASGHMLEDLEFDLDGDGKPEGLDIDDVGDPVQEVDLSEIEKMLEEPEAESVDFSNLPEQDMDLEVAVDLESDKWMSDAGDEDRLLVDEELDLSELEQALDDVGTDAVEGALEEPELELELGGDKTLDAPDETVAIDNEIVFELSDFETEALSTSAVDDPLLESTDMVLEFEVEGDNRALEDDDLEETLAVAPSRADEKPQAALAEPVRKPIGAPRAEPVNKRSRKSLVVILIIALLGGGGFGAYYLLQQRGIEIPFLSGYLKPAVQDPGFLRMTTHDINSRFIENANVGRLFVVSGMVQNGYPTSRSTITVAGEIFAAGRIPVQKETVYCGNVMSDLELANLEWEQITARLANRLGDNRSNVRIEPGASIPFMVVFSGLPDDLEEFTIEVTGSTPLG